MMSQNHSKTRRMPTGKQTGMPGQANGGNGHSPSSGRLSWYFAQPTMTGLTYVLTATGYMILPNREHRN